MEISSSDETPGARAGMCSIWTIDLAHLLRRFGADVAMTTTTLGANPQFSSEAFYADNLPDDERRVQRLFKVRPSPIRRLVCDCACQQVELH